MGHARRNVDVRALIFILWVCLLAMPAEAYNSLVRYEDVPALRELGVSQEVIQYLMANQTSSTGSQEVLRMKKAGMTNEEILAAIKADLYRPKESVTAIEEAELIAKLKQAGMSDEAVLQFLNTVKSRSMTDFDGNRVTRYTNMFQRRQYPTSGTVFPEVRDYGYDPGTGRYLIIAPNAAGRPTPPKP
jgi:hypothetical protein